MLTYEDPPQKASWPPVPLRGVCQSVSPTQSSKPGFYCFTFKDSQKSPEIEKNFVKDVSI